MVIVFGNRFFLSDAGRYKEIEQFYPNAHIVCGSSAGEILGNVVKENSLVCTAVYFEKTTIRVASASIQSKDQSYTVGKKLSSELQDEDLANIFVISDGQIVNGSELVKGLNSANHSKVAITGGLAGDGGLFEKTLVGYNEPPKEGEVVAVGFYGKNLKVGHGTFGGWDTFGPIRTVTKSRENILCELDNQSALQLYKKYLGPLSSELPQSALMFPLAIIQENGMNLVRTILSVNEEEQSMTFAGDIPLNSKVKLMKANFDKLIDASATASGESLSKMNSIKPQLAMLISCVGRKLVLSHRVEEEVEEAVKLFEPTTFVTGFYSYGEISPLSETASCELHNQTMTITTFSEDLHL